MIFDLRFEGLGQSLTEANEENEEANQEASAFSATKETKPTKNGRFADEAKKIFSLG